MNIYPTRRPFLDYCFLVQSMRTPKLMTSTSHLGVTPRSGRRSLTQVLTYSRACAEVLLPYSLATSLYRLIA